MKDGDRGQSGGAHGEQGPQGPPRDQQAGRAAGGRHDEALEEQRPHHLPPAGAQCHAHRDLLAPARRARELQVRGVDARDEQHHADRGQQDHQGGPKVAEQRRLQRARPALGPCSTRSRRPARGAAATRRPSRPAPRRRGRRRERAPRRRSTRSGRRRAGLSSTGVQTSALAGKRKSGGMTPTTVYGCPSSVTVGPDHVGPGAEAAFPQPMPDDHGLRSRRGGPRRRRSRGRPAGERPGR